MLYAHFPDASCFKKILDSIQHYEKLMFHFSQDGLSFQGNDKSNVSLLNVNLPSELFDGYLCDQAMTVAIDLKQFYKVIKLAYKYNGITLTDSDNPDQVRVEFTSEAGAQRTIDIQQIGMAEDEHFLIPEIRTDCTVVIPCAELLQVVQEASEWFDAISIRTSGPEEIEIMGNGSPSTVKNIKTKIATSYSEDERRKISVIIFSNFKRFYNLRLVKHITKAANLSPTVILNFLSTTVLLVEFKILGSGTMQFFLPEKLEEDQKTSEDAKNEIREETD